MPVWMEIAFSSGFMGARLLRGGFVPVSIQIESDWKLSGKYNKKTICQKIEMIPHRILED